MATTLGVRSLIVLVGAGYTGSYVYNNVTMEKARNIAADLLMSYRKGSQDNSSTETSSVSATDNGRAVDALSQQMDRLTREVSKNRSDPVVIVGPTGYKGSLATVTDVFNLLGWVVFATSVGGAVYYIAVRKRWPLRDLLWVSQTKFNDTVTAMQNGITRVSGVVNSVRRDLGERLRKMEGKVEHVEASLSKQIESEVGDVKEGVGRLGDDVSDVRRGVSDVSHRVVEMSDKLDSTNYGIHLLLGVVSSLAPDKIKPGSPFYDLKKFMQSGDSSGFTEEIEHTSNSSSSIIKRVSQTGLGILLPFDKANGSSGDGDVTKSNDRSKERSFDGSAPSWSAG